MSIMAEEALVFAIDGWKVLITFMRIWGRSHHQSLVLKE